MPQENEQVLVDKSVLDSLMSRVQSLETGSAVLAPEPVKDHTVRIRLIDDFVVSRIGRTWEERDDIGEIVLKAEIFYLKDGKEAKKTMGYLEFIHGAKEVVAKVVEQNTVTKKDNFGTIEMTSVEGFKTLGTGMKRPLEVVHDERSFLIRLPSGEQLTVSERAVNI